MQVVINIPEDVLKRTAFYREFRDLNDCVTTIKALEKAVPLPKEQWIPVRDPLNELPKDKHLLVTVEYEVWPGENSHYVTELYYDMTEWSDINDAKNAIAYMSYPEPYEAESEEEE